MADMLWALAHEKRFEDYPRYLDAMNPNQHAFTRDYTEEDIISMFEGGGPV